MDQKQPLSSALKACRVCDIGHASAGDDRAKLVRCAPAGPTGAAFLLCWLQATAGPPAKPSSNKLRSTNWYRNRTVSTALSSRSIEAADALNTDRVDNNSSCVGVKQSEPACCTHSLHGPPPLHSSSQSLHKRLQPQLTPVRTQS